MRGGSAAADNVLGLRLMHWNVRSISQQPHVKFAAVRKVMADVVSLQETRSRVELADYDHVYAREALCINGSGKLNAVLLMKKGLNWRYFDSGVDWVAIELELVGVESRNSNLGLVVSAYNRPGKRAEEEE